MAMKVWPRQSGPGQWCMVYTGEANEDREPRVSLASREEASGDSIVSPAQGGQEY